MEISEIETLWKEKKREATREARKKFIITYICCFIVMSFLFFRVFHFDSFLFFFTVLFGSLMISFLFNPDIIGVSYEVREGFFNKHKASFYEDELEVSVFEVIEMKKKMHVFVLLLKNTENQLERTVVPFSKLKLECDIDKVTTAVKHSPIVKDMSLISEFHSIIWRLEYDDDNVSWFLM